jgi:ubiquinone/menaquinone biosynthesis C-methylase UbiE
MGAEDGRAAQTPLGEPVVLVSAAEGYRLWAPDYDTSHNPLLALEMRILESRLGIAAGDRFLDAGAGTGRWMKHAETRGACAFGIDSSAEMLARGSGARVRADIRRLPVADNAVDLAMCSMVLGYVRSAGEALRELTRVARRVVVSDLHPDAVAAGWTRSFRRRGQVYEIGQYRHSLRALKPEGTREEWFVEAKFGEPERSIFNAAGKTDAFDGIAGVPAICAVCWIR